MPSGGMASDCEDAMMNTPRGGSGGVKLTANVADGATVAPGEEIAVRLAWDRNAWTGDRLDMALACVRVKGALDPNMSAQERPSANDGVFEYRVQVPDNIKPGCDICVQGFLAGMSGDGGPQQVGSNEQCFMSGPPGPPEDPTPPVTRPPTPPNTPTTAVQPPPRQPDEVPSEAAGSSTSDALTPAPAAPPSIALGGELPRTGPSIAQVGTASGGLTLALGGLAVIGGAGRRTRRRIGA
jgi:hypothetical protein